PSTDTHCRDNVAHSAAAALEQSVADQPRTADSIRMSDGDRSAIHVEAIVGNAQPIRAIQNLHGECLIQLPETDILDVESSAPEELGHGKDGADTHFIRFAPRYCKAPEYPQRLQPATFRKTRINDHGRRCPIRELARVASGNRA